MRQTKLFDNISHASLEFYLKYSCVCAMEMFKDIHNQVSQRNKI